MMQKNKHSIKTEDLQLINKSLSILIKTDGFSFCIDDLSENKTISFSAYEFPNITHTETLLEKVIEIFAQDQDLHHDFKKIEVIHQNQLSTLVPNIYFDKNKLKEYLDYNIKTSITDYITFDSIKTIDIKNIYVPFVHINDYFFQNFGEFEFKHHSTVIIEKLINYHHSNPSKNFFIHVSKNSLDIVIIKNGTLVLYNSFLYTSPQDFIYYILLVAEQLEMNPDNFILTMLGDIKLNDKNYTICYDYIRNIEFIKTNSIFFNASESFSNHSNYILIS